MKMAKSIIVLRTVTDTGDNMLRGQFSKSNNNNIINMPIIKAYEWFLCLVIVI